MLTPVECVRSHFLEVAGTNQESPTGHDNAGAGTVLARYPAIGERIALTVGNGLTEVEDIARADALGKIIERDFRGLAVFLLEFPDHTGDNAINLANEREQLKELTQYDPRRMKKNLDANKKKLAEKTRANELLQKSLKDVRGEKLEAERKMQELEGLKADMEPEEKAA